MPDPSTRSVFVSALALGTAVGAFGLVFGVGAVASGASLAQTCVLSLLVFTGASQFSAVSVVAAGGTPGAAFGGAMLLAARNAVYGLTVSRVVRGSLPSRLVAAHLTIDESTAMALAQGDAAHQRVAFWVTGVTVFIGWNLSTLAGGLIGTGIDPLDYGLDGAFPAAFCAMVAPHLRTPRGRLAGLLGALICLATIPFTPVGVPILCAGAAILVGLPEERTR
jgi:predicted branched-subunit amino acid permease